MQEAADLFFPRCCITCGEKLFDRSLLFFCRECRAEIQYLESQVCRRCGVEFAVCHNKEHFCGDCLRNFPPYTLARSVVRYSEPVKKLLYRLKYREDPSVLPGIADIVSCYDMSEFEHCDYAVPVPLHIKRLRERGLNQSMLLAELFFKRISDFSVRSDVLVREIHTVPQTSLDGPARRKNLAKAFKCRGEADVSGRNICLVDDVFTTGTTVGECSRTLLEYGAKEVRILTFARA
ncbi:double zinc ribbon domain-containing protein [Desulfomarina sp.]